MNNYKLENTKSNNTSIDQEQLKLLSVKIKKYIDELSNSKKKADLAWEKCGECLGENTFKEVNLRRVISTKKYNKGIEQLETFADKLVSISNIWLEAETEITKSTKRLENIFSDIQKNLNYYLENYDIDNNR